MRRFRLWGMGLAAFLLWGGICRGQDSLGIQKLSEIYDWKWLKGVFLSDSLAFVASYGSGLRVINIGDNTNLFEISACLDDKEAQSISGLDNYVFLTYGDTMSIVDISNPLMPQVLGSCQSGATIFNTAATADYLLSACGSGGLMILDISDPSAPFPALNLPLPGVLEDLFILDHHAYIAAGEAGLVILDIENPLLPEMVGQYDSPYWASAVFAESDYAYLGDSGAGLRVVDISSPSMPVAIGYAPVHGDITEVIKEGNYVFMVQNYNAPYGYECSFRSIDVSLPTNPVIQGSCYFDGSVYGFSISGAYAAAATHMGLRTVDLSNPTQPEISGFLSYDLSGEQAAQVDQYLYLTGNDGIWIFNISDPIHPTSEKLLSANSHVEAVQTRDSLLFVAGHDPELEVFDITLPLNPILVCSLNLTNSVQEMLVQDSLVFLIGRWLGLAVVDVSDPGQPALLGSLNFASSNWMYDIAAKDNCVYIIEGGGYRVIDVSDPSAPFEVAFVSLPDWGNAVAVYSDYLYAAASDSGLVIFDISNPLQPVEIGRYLPVWGSARDICIKDGHIILSCYGGLSVLDISTPDLPVEVGYYPSQNEYSVFVWGNYALAEEYHCLNLYDISIALPVAPEPEPIHPSSFRLHPCHPNPFNPSTVASFELRFPSHVSLRVYDTAGRFVGKLVDGWRQAGKHQAIFDGSDLPSGIYLARLTAGKFQQTQKLVLMK